jgi:Protein of unknown function (DUF1592)/Protein of unknown function (DUF1588)/Protein of unknown function (DUF1595)/Protein of unknown function (DUF1585)
MVGCSTGNAYQRQMSTARCVPVACTGIEGGEKLTHVSSKIAPGSKNCNAVKTKGRPVWPHSVALGVLLAMAARLAKSRIKGWIFPALLGIGGCSGGVVSEQDGPWGKASEGADSGTATDETTKPGPTTSDNASAGTEADLPPGDGGVAPPFDVTPAPPEQNPPIAPTTFACDPAIAPDSTPLRRLSQIQYENSVRDVLARMLGNIDESSDALTAILGELPEDERLKLPQDLHGTYRRLDQRVQQPHVDAWFRAGVEIGKWLSASDRLGVALGDCGRFDDSRACVRDFIARFGRIAFRRPLGSEEVDFFYGFYEPSTGIDGAGVADVVAGMLNAPDFLYLVEGRGEVTPDNAQVYQLTSHELAARLSYHFWNTLPDAQLSALADSGELMAPEVYQAQVARLFADERTLPTTVDFYSEWLKLEDLSPLDRNNDSSIFQAFAGDNLPSERLADAMRDEVQALLGYYTFEQPGGVSEVLNTPYSFATSSELASIYGVQAWDGLGTPPRVETERPGLLTRGAFLATGTANTRPIMRGLFVRTNLLCDTIAPPPAEAGATPPELSPNSTTREVVEELTAPTACFGCHNAFINPLGFAFEGFDSLGRVRTEQRLFDEDGNEIGAKPIDTASVPQVVLGDNAASEGPADVMRLLSGSGKVEACLARQYFRFTFGRWEQLTTDGCALEQMRQAARPGGSLATLLREVALSATFRTRTVTDDADAIGGEP